MPRLAPDPPPPNGQPAAAPLLVRRREAARLCGVSPSTWDRLAAAGRTPAPLRLGGAVVWRVAELAAWVAAGMPPRAEWEAREKETCKGRK